MKLILESWRKYLNEAEATCEEPNILYHGSPAKFDGPLEPRQAHDVGGRATANLKAVYATEDKKMSITMGLLEKGGDIFSDFKGIDGQPPGQLVAVRGKIRHGEKMYLYKLPKATFTNTEHPSDSPEWFSEVAVQPCGIEELNVDDYLHLVREATPQDMEFWNKHNVGE
jgi:hypothetical protein